jgi:hypothetical protein
MSKQSPLPLRRKALLCIGVVGAFTIALLTPTAANAILTGSTFEGNDGNMVHGSPTTTDWDNVAGLNTGIDLPTGKTDNSFGQGTKEDATNPTVVNGSIPPNKNDLTRFYEASEQVSNGNIFLYLAWERLVNIGSANLDFEINQQSSPTFTAGATGPVTIVRTAGDLLVSYDFQGSGTPVIGLSKWLTAANGDNVANCNASNTLPCWGSHVTVSSANSEGAVNAAAITDPISGQSLGVGLFGETAINLTGAGVFPPGVCEAFGSAFVKSRSSTSFSAELKDFIAPIAVNISNCGSITIKKVTQNAPAGDTSQFPYTTTNLTPASFNLLGGGQKVFSKLGQGTYGVTEGAEPSTSWNFVSLTCDTTETITGKNVSISLAPGQNVTCTYTNHYTNSPTIATTLSATSVDVGSTVHDSATLTGATSGASGSVTYTVYTDNACTLNPRDAGTVTVSNGTVPDSNALAFNSVGTFYWQAVYTGDGDNNGATSACTSEVLTVNKAQPMVSTAQNVIPNDSMTLSGGFNPSGSITFNLYAPTDATCSGTPALTQTVTVASGDGVYSTTNTTFVASTEGTWRWASSYSGDASNKPATSTCGTEQFTILNH